MAHKNDVSNKRKKNRTFAHPLDSCRFCSVPLRFKEACLGLIVPCREGGRNKGGNRITVCRRCASRECQRFPGWSHVQPADPAAVAREAPAPAPGRARAVG